jgi:hypothetical protein
MRLLVDLFQFHVERILSRAIWYSNWLSSSFFFLGIFQFLGLLDILGLLGLDHLLRSLYQCSLDSSCCFLSYSCTHMIHLLIVRIGRSCTGASTPFYMATILASAGTVPN